MLQGGQGGPAREHPNRRPVALSIMAGRAEAAWGQRCLAHRQYWNGRILRLFTINPWINRPWHL